MPARGKMSWAVLVLVAAVPPRGIDAAERTASNDKEVLSAIADSAPGDTITLKAGYYDGGWKLKPGAEGKPITLRAERAGRVFVGSVGIIRGFEPVAGREYSRSRPFDSALTKLRELDTGAEMRWMASDLDVEEVVGSFYCDEKARRLYVHPSDSAGTERHLYGAIMNKTGITLANYTVVNGLVMAGFGEAAIVGGGVTGVTVQNCKIYRSGFGISLDAAKNCVIRNNEAWENRPDYNQGSQIYMGNCQGILVEANTVHNSLNGELGIFFYGDNKSCIMRGNLMWDTGVNCFKAGDEHCLTEYNVCIRSSLGGLSSPMRCNTFTSAAAAPGIADPQSNLDISQAKDDPGFADPAWMDYRLQSDSPARGKGKGGADLGACPYKADVFFVKPDGSDQAEGASVAAAWKTLARATAALQSGQTLYVLPGRYEEPLNLAGKAAAAGKKTAVRVRGKGKAWVRGVQVADSKGIELANFSVTGEPADGFRVVNSEDITLLNCGSYLNKGDGVSVQGSRGVSLQHCALSQNAGAGFHAVKSSDLEVTSSIFFENKQQELLDSDAAGYYSNGNAVGGAASVPAFKPVDPAEGDFRVPSESAAACGDLFQSPVGPDGIFANKTVARKPIEHVEVVSTTRTSANLRWLTPGRMCGTILEWGQTGKYGNLYDRGAAGYSEYLFVHTVSLINLKPDTVYHYRIGYRNFWAAESEKIGDQWPMIWSEDQTFRTAAEDPPPRQLFVALDGDDSRDGATAATAWRTLHKACREAHVGDTVNIAPGRYVELLCPLQTGTGEKGRITFRGERPFSVILDGGASPNRKLGVRGQPYGVLLCGKAFITIENITATNFGRNAHDYGGYRGGYGYAGVFRISGGVMNEFKGCVADIRDWSCGFVFLDGGLMPDPQNTKYAYYGHICDSATVGCWKAIIGMGGPQLLLDHNVYYVSYISIYEGLVMRASHDCIYQDLCTQKRSEGCSCSIIGGWAGQTKADDYNDFAWMPGSAKKITGDKDGKPVTLEMWRKNLGQDVHSVELTPDYPLTPLHDQKTDRFNPRPLAIEDFILPGNSPLRTAGTGGGMIGVRWDQWLEKK